MARLWVLIPSLLVWACATPAGIAGEAEKDCLPAVVSGSGDVAVQGRAAARSGDAAGCGDAVVEGSPDVLINGRPAAVTGAKTGCGGAIVTGTSGVFINGKPVAGAGSLTSECPPN